jgi:uncharacterized OsmC-like protein
MKITLTSDDSILLEPTAGPMTIEAPDADTQYSAFHMVAGGLAYCTFSVLHSWASNANVKWDDLTVEISWKFADNPHRVTSYDVKLNWPSLPENRRNVALRAADLCPVHATLVNPPQISTNIVVAQKVESPGLPAAATTEQIGESSSGP